MPTPEQIQAQVASLETRGGIDWSTLQPEKEAHLIAEAQAREAEVAKVGLPEVAVAPGVPEKVDAPPPSDEVAGPGPQGPVAVPPTYPERLRIRARDILALVKDQIGVHLSDTPMALDLERAILYLEAADEFERQR